MREHIEKSISYLADYVEFDGVKKRNIELSGVWSKDEIQKELDKQTTTPFNLYSEITINGKIVYKITRIYSSINDKIINTYYEELQFEIMMLLINQLLFQAKQDKND